MIFSLTISVGVNDSRSAKGFCKLVTKYTGSLNKNSLCTKSSFEGCRQKAISVCWLLSSCACFLEEDVSNICTDIFGQSCLNSLRTGGNSMDIASSTPLTRTRFRPEAEHCLALSTERSISPKTPLTFLRKSTPACVKLTCRVVRNSKLTPTEYSNEEIRSDSADWLIDRRSAARRKFSSSATATKHSNCFKSNGLCLYFIIFTRLCSGKQDS